MNPQETGQNSLELKMTALYLRTPRVMHPDFLFQKALCKSPREKGGFMKVTWKWVAKMEEEADLGAEKTSQW